MLFFFFFCFLCFYYCVVPDYKFSMLTLYSQPIKACQHIMPYLPQRDCQRIIIIDALLTSANAVRSVHIEISNLIYLNKFRHPVPSSLHFTHKFKRPQRKEAPSP